MLEKILTDEVPEIDPVILARIHEMLPEALWPDGGEFTPEGEERVAELFAKIDAGEVSE